MLTNGYYYAPHDHALLTEYLDRDLERMASLGADIVSFCAQERYNEAAQAGSGWAPSHPLLHIEGRQFEIVKLYLAIGPFERSDRETDQAVRAIAGICVCVVVHLAPVAVHANARTRPNDHEMVPLIVVVDPAWRAHPSLQSVETLYRFDAMDGPKVLCEIVAEHKDIILGPIIAATEYQPQAVQPPAEQETRIHLQFEIARWPPSGPRNVIGRVVLYDSEISVCPMNESSVHRFRKLERPGRIRAIEILKPDPGRG